MFQAIQRRFVPQQACRILLVSDFSEECDDEVAFELLVSACANLPNYQFTIELLFPDAEERIQWFATL